MPAVILFVLAVAVVVCGVASIAGRLPRNRWVGIHTEHSMRSDEAFRLANRVAAPTMIAAGGLLAVAGALALMFDGLLGIVAIVVTTIAAVIPAGNGAAIANRAAEALTAKAGSCGHSCTSCSLKDSCQPS